MDHILTGIDGFAQNNRPARLHAKAAFWSGYSVISPFDYTTVSQNMAQLRRGQQSGTDLHTLSNFIRKTSGKEGKPHFIVMTDGDFWDDSVTDDTALTKFQEALSGNKNATVDFIFTGARNPRTSPFNHEDSSAGCLVSSCSKWYGVSHFIKSLKDEFGDRISLQRIEENSDAAAIIRRTVVARRRPVEKSKIKALTK